MTIVKRTSAPLAGQPRVDFIPSGIDALIENKGLYVVLESAIACPCKSSGGDSPLSTCRNCGGVGIVFINPTKQKMIVQAIGRDHKRIADWSSELKGTVSLTTRNATDIGDYDRVTIVGSRSLFSQLVHIKKYEGILYGFLVYNLSEVIDVFMFDGSDNKLLKLAPTDYTVEGNAFILNQSFIDRMSNDGGITITIRYSHEVQYLITEQGHEIRDSYVLTGSTNKKERLPVSAIGRRTHYVMTPSNLDGRLLLDNSYITGTDDTCNA